MKQNKDVYVIQRKDGMFYYDWVFDKGVSKPRFTRKIEHCFHNKQFGTENWAKTEIRCSELEDCKPMKVTFNTNCLFDNQQDIDYGVLTINAFNENQIKLLTDRWEKLKDWVLSMRPLIRGSNIIFTKGALLDKIFELEKEK